MSLISKQKKVRDCFSGIDCDVYHYWRSKKNFPCLIWAEDSESSSAHADNKKQEQVLHGTADYFTRKEYDLNIDVIQNNMNKTQGLSWRLNSVQYEEETNMIHFEWEFEVV